MSKKILIADDEDNIRELVMISLEDEGFSLYEAVDGNEAVRKAKEIKPDLVILDVMMPGKIGYDVCEEIKSNPETSQTFVIFLSARGNPLAERTGKSKGGDDYMTKPFEPEELRRKVRAALKI